MNELEEVEKDIQQIAEGFANLISAIQSNQNSKNTDINHLTKDLGKRLEDFEIKIKGSELLTRNYEEIEKENKELEEKYQKMMKEKRILEEKVNTIRSLFETLESN